MNTHSHKQNQSKSSSSLQRKNNQEQPIAKFADNRPEAIFQRRMQEAMQNSPQVKQLQAIQEMANNSPQARQTAQLQEMINNSEQTKQFARFQEMANNSPQAQQTAQLQQMINNSERAKQMKVFQEMAGNSPQAQQTAQLQEMVNNYHVAQNTAPIQKKENKTGLPDTLKSGVENLSSYSMDDVKVHYNSSKPAQLNAHAYAQGTDIHLASGQEKHLPHEAWHVVQQKQGRVKPTMQMAGGVNVNDDRGLEKEADVMGGMSLSVGEQKSPQNKSIDAFLIARKPKNTVQKVGIGDRPFESGYQNILADPQWFSKAEKYEQRLGSYTSKSPKALTALYSAISKMHEVFKKYYKDNFEDDQSGILKKLFFRDDKTSAGQVGLDLDVNKMLNVLGRGNLRERMTAFYNASYYGAGYGGSIQEGFKAILQDIVANQKWDVSNDLDLDTDSLKKQEKFMEGWSRTSIHKIVNTIKEEKAYNYGKDLFALGNLTYQTDDYLLTNTREIAESQMDRKMRSKDSDSKIPEKHRKTPEDYQNMDVPLSDNELAYQYPKDIPEGFLDKWMNSEEGFRREKTKNKKLEWEEGTALFEISPDNSWYKRIHDKMKMPVVAGVSGTTTRLLNSFKWLNTGFSALDFRLAIMGWMLTSWDHSLYEILRGSHIAGFKGDNEENTVNDVIRMYMNIAPLPVDELRNRVAENGMFPHEWIYHKQTLEKDETKPQAIVPGKDLRGTDVANEGKDKIYDSVTGNKKAEYANLSEAHAIAIYTYTSGAHNILNSVMSFNMSEKLAKENIKGKLSYIINHYAQIDFLRAKQVKGTISPTELLKLGELQANGVEWINVLTPKRDLIKTTIGNPDIEKSKRESFYKNTIEVWLIKLIDRIYPELKMQANMTVEGLSNLPAVDGEIVWRGDWVSILSRQYSKGETVSFPTFTSFSRNRNKAEGFSTAGQFSEKMLIKLELKGKGGKDVSNLSMYSNEEEVLLMPNSKMKIKNTEWIKIGDEYVWFADAEEV